MSESPALTIKHPSIAALVKQTVGVDLQNQAQLAKFISSVDTFCQTNEIAVRIGKSLHSASIVVAVFDPQLRVLIWNGWAAKTTGYSLDDVKTKHILQELKHLFHQPEVASATIQAAFKQCYNGHPVHGTILELRKKDGKVIKLLCNFSPFLNTQNSPSGMTLIAHDISTGAASFLDNEVAETPSAAETPMDGSSGKSGAPPRQPAYSRFAGWNEIGDEYVIESVLGQGSYGQVARARHKKTNETVAIKKIQNVFVDPIDAKRILRELCIVRQLKHPNIVQIREILRPKEFDTFNDLYVVFEYLPTDLEKLLHSPQFLTAEHLRWLLLDLLKAVKYMHSAKIVHRDLKPANVLLNLSPVSIKICDFGLSRGFSTDSEEDASTKFDDSSNLDNGGSIHPRTPRQKIQRQLTEHVVTRWYRAPEIIFRAHNYSTGIDVWSVGCIFAELLSMQQSSVSSHYNREPLFPGVSCFPLSPGNNSPALPQDSRDQLNVILDVLGTMDEEDIADIDDPDVRTYLRGIEPRRKKSFKEMYPGAEDSALELLEWMLQMNPKKRATLDNALGHRYLESIRSLEEESVAADPILLEFDAKVLTIPEIRRLIQREILYYHPEEPASKKAKLV